MCSMTAAVPDDTIDAMTTPTDDRRRMLAGLPITERRVAAAGVGTMVIEAGEGPPVVLLHGGIECGAAYWAPVLARLCAANRVIAPDAPGLGESAPAERLDPDTFAAWFDDLLARTGTQRPALVAHSLLGTAAARYAARRPHALSRLVISGGPGIGPHRMPARLRYVGLRFAVRPTSRNLERFARFAMRDVDAVRDRDPDWYAAFDGYECSRARVGHVARTMRYLLRAETKQIAADELRRIAVPVTLLWGRHDRMVPLAVAEHASAMFGWPLVVIEDAAHVSHVEQPDAFVRALSSILATSPSE